MKRLKLFAVLHPLLFVMIFVLVSVLLIAIAYSWSVVFPSTELNQYLGQSLIQVVSTLCFIFVLWRFGWLQISGFASLGRGRAWIIVLLALTYVLAKDIYLRTGGFSFELPDPTLGFWLGLSSLTAGLFEETVFLGVVLSSFLLLWDHSRFGLTRSISMTALLFGGIHIVRLVEDPLAQTLLTMLTASLAGFFYGVIYLYGGSIWIPVAFHGSYKAVVNLHLAGKGAVETPLIGLLTFLTHIPVFLVGIYLLKKIRRSEGNRRTIGVSQPRIKRI